MDPVVEEVEEAFVAHWSLLGQWPGAALVDEDGVLRFETSIRSLPYNGVIRSAIEADPGELVARVADVYARRGAQFFWLVHPSAEPADLAASLEAGGLSPVERATGMSLELDAWQPRPPQGQAAVEFSEVRDEEELRAYNDMVLAYWELDESDREHIARLNRHWSGSRAKGQRWLGHLDGEPVAKGYLSFAGPPGVAAIYGMSVRQEARGLGIAGDLTQTLLRAATERGSRRVVLHSSDMAVGVYRRAGFVERCTFTVYATAPIWSGEH